MRRLLGIVTLCATLCGCAAKDDPQQVPGDGGVDLATCVTDGPVGTPRPNCPSDLPPDDDCATASPVYDDVAPIFAARCRICHTAGGLETKYVFDTYAQIHDVSAIRTLILTQIYSCRMPPSCAPDLSADERKTMLKWFVCGAPENHDAGSDSGSPEASLTER
jgi:hypothetical protein